MTQSMATPEPSSRTVCGGVENGVSVLTLVRRGVAQVFHVLRVEELREQLEVEEEEEKLKK